MFEGIVQGLQLVSRCLQGAHISEQACCHAPPLLRSATPIPKVPPLNACDSSPCYQFKTRHPVTAPSSRPQPVSFIPVHQTWLMSASAPYDPPSLYHCNSAAAHRHASFPRSPALAVVVRVLQHEGRLPHYRRRTVDAPGRLARCSSR